MQAAANNLRMRRQKLLHRRAPGPSMQQPGVAADFKAGHGPNLTVHLTAPLLTAQLHTAHCTTALLLGALLPGPVGLFQLS